MLNNIIEFFKNLFASLFGGSQKEDWKKEDKPLEDQLSELDKLPDILPGEPQDAADLDDDQQVEVTDEKEVLETRADESVPDVPEEPTTETGEPEAEPPVAEETEQQHVQRYLWCLDNGHGSLQAGKRSPVFDDGVTQFFEYEFNRDIVKRIIAALEKKGVAYYNVVPEVAVDDFLKERVYRANTKKSPLPKLFVSIHANAAPTSGSSPWASDDIHGIETWHFHRSSDGQQLASIFQKHLIEQTGWNNRHIKSRPNRQFYVLQKTSMTAVLTENGFYNNKAQALELMKDDVRQTIADAHVAAILEVEEKGL